MHPEENRTCTLMLLHSEATSPTRQRSAQVQERENKKARQLFPLLLFVYANTETWGETSKRGERFRSDGSQKTSGPLSYTLVPFETNNRWRVEIFVDHRAHHVALLSVDFDLLIHWTFFNNTSAIQFDFCELWIGAKRIERMQACILEYSKSLRRCLHWLADGKSKSVPKLREVELRV